MSTLTASTFTTWTHNDIHFLALLTDPYTSKDPLYLITDHKGNHYGYWSDLNQFRSFQKSNFPSTTPMPHATVALTFTVNRDLDARPPFDMDNDWF